MYGSDICDKCIKKEFDIGKNKNHIAQFMTYGLDCCKCKGVMMFDFKKQRFVCEKCRSEKGCDEI